jgi:hypothetical protein
MGLVEFIKTRQNKQLQIKAQIKEEGGALPLHIGKEGIGKKNK